MTTYILNVTPITYQEWRLATAVGGYVSKIVARAIRAHEKGRSRAHTRRMILSARRALAATTLVTGREEYYLRAR